MTCKTCGDEFTPYPGKPGYINQCARCGAKKEVPLKMAKVSWENKHTPIIEVCDAREAIAFNRAQRRFGTSVVTGFGRGPAAEMIYQERKELERE